MNEVVSYSFVWNNVNDEGTMNLVMKNGAGHVLLVDSASEGLLLLDLLRNEKPVFYNADANLVMTGMEWVGEGDNDSDAD